MSKDVVEIKIPGLIGVVLVIAVLFGGVMLFTWTMEWLTSVFSTPQLIFAFAMLVPAAFLLRYMSAGALVFNRKELEAMEGGIGIFAFLFFGVGFFMLTSFLMPESIKEASNRGDIISAVIGSVGGVAMMVCFSWLLKKLKIRGKLRANLEGYPSTRPKSRL